MKKFTNGKLNTKYLIGVIANLNGRYYKQNKGSKFGRKFNK